MNVKHSMGALHSFSIKNIFYTKMDLRLFCFQVTMYKQMPQGFLAAGDAYTKQYGEIIKDIS